MNSTSIRDFRRVVIREFKLLGFSTLGRSGLLAARRGDLYNIAYVRQSSIDDSAQVVVGVWHPSAVTMPGLSLIERVKSEIQGGDLSPWGIGAGKWWWPSEGFSEQLLVECIRELAGRWLSAFSSLADWAFLRRDSSAQAPYEISADALALLAGLGSLAEPLPMRVLTPHTRESHRNLMKGLVAEMLNLVGFETYETDRQLAFTRKCGELWDVVEPGFASFGIHTVVNCYVTTPHIWSARRELKGLLVQTNGGELGHDGFCAGVRCFETAQLSNEVGIARLRCCVVEQAIPFFNGVRDRKTFLRLLGMGWERTIGSALSHVWKS